MQEEAQVELKTARKPSKVRLQGREYEVLSELERWGLLGLAQLEGLLFRQGVEAREKMGLFFNDYDREAFDRYGYKRLFRLEKAGYIQRFDERWRSAGSYGWAYGLTKAGKAKLDRARPAPGPDFRRKWSGRVVLDYVRLNGVGLVLAKVLRLKVKSKHQLACERRDAGMNEARIQSRLPDLMIEEKTPLAVRVGFSWDWPKERRLWQIWARHPMLYLTSRLGKREVLWRAKDAYGGQVFAGELDDFREKLGETAFTDAGNRTTTLDQMVGRSDVPWGT